MMKESPLRGQVVYYLSGILHEALTDAISHLRACFEMGEFGFTGLLMKNKMATQFNCHVQHNFRNLANAEAAPLI
jgi:hypothetical protein